jgi:hypothetical protein
MMFIANPHACTCDLKQVQHLCNIEFNFDVGQKGHMVLIDGTMFILHVFMTILDAILTRGR